MISIPIVPMLVLGWCVHTKTIEQQAARVLDGAIANQTTGCLETTVCKDACGYGMVSSGGKTYRAHVVVWISKKGIKPVGLNVLHECDNPSCVNIDHLHLGTPADNAIEMVQRGRQSGRYPQKLRAEDIATIHARRLKGESQGSIAKSFGVRSAAISRVLSNARWGHLGFQAVGHFFAHQKLSESDVRRLRERRAQGVTQRLLALEFGIQQAQVSRILNGVRRKSVT